MIGHVVIEKGQIKLDVQGFFVQLAGEIHARLGRVDVPVQAEDQVVRHDRIAGGEKRHQTLDEMSISRAHALLHMAEIDLKIDLLHAPSVLDRRSIHLVEPRITHRPQRQIEAGIEYLTHWHASQVSGLSSEHASASAPAGAVPGRPGIAAAAAAGSRTVVFEILVAGRERR